METKFRKGETAKYLVNYLDRSLTWRAHMFAKRKQMGLKSPPPKKKLDSRKKIGAINRKSY